MATPRGALHRDLEQILRDLKSKQAAAFTVAYNGGNRKAYDDRTVCTGDPEETLLLTYAPADHTVHLYLNGQFQDDDTWTLDGYTMTVDNSDGWARAGDMLVAKYESDDPTPRPPSPSGSVTLHAHNLTVSTDNPLDPSSQVGGGEAWNDGSDTTGASVWSSADDPTWYTDTGVADLDTLDLPAGSVVSNITVNVRLQQLHSDPAGNLAVWLQIQTADGFTVATFPLVFTSGYGSGASVVFSTPLTGNPAEKAAAAEALQVDGVRLSLACAVDHATISEPYSFGTRVVEASVTVDYVGS